jgi:hypothetical protein
MYVVSLKVCSSVSLPYYSVYVLVVRYCTDLRTTYILYYEECVNAYSVEADDISRNGKTLLWLFLGGCIFVYRL